MRVIEFSAALLFASFVVPAMAQTGGSRSVVPEIIDNDRANGASAQPTPTGARSAGSQIAPTVSVADSEQPRDYLVIAKDSLSKGRTRAAQEALEMAETRLLNRTVRREDINMRDSSPMVQTISEARQALENGKIDQSIQLIDAAISR